MNGPRAFITADARYMLRESPTAWIDTDTTMEARE